MRGPWRGERVHVLADRCSTCVFRPHNLMNLQDGRLQNLVKTNREGDTALTCHQTLEQNKYDAEPAVCRGYFDAYGDEVTPLRLAKIMGLIEEDSPPTCATGSLS